MISGRMFNTTVTISRVAKSQSASGGTTNDSAVAQYTGVPCALQPDTSSVIVEQKRLAGRRGATLFLPPTTLAGTTISVSAHDICAVGGVNWKAVGPSIDASAGRGELLRVPVEAPLA